MAGCFCLSRPPASSGAEAVKPKAPPSDGPFKERCKTHAAAAETEPAEPLIGAVKAEDARGGLAEEEDLNRGETPQRDDGEPIEAAAEDLQLAGGGGSAAPLLGEAAPAELAPISADAVAAVAEEMAVDPNAKATGADPAAASGKGGCAGATDADSLQPSESHEVQVHAASCSSPLGEGSCSQAASTADEEAEADAASMPEVAQDAQPLAAGGSSQVAAGAAAEGRREGAATGSRRSSMQELAEEGSRAALLPPSEVSLKQPCLSQLSSFFSCTSSRAGGDNGEHVIKQQVRSSSPPEPGHLQLDFGAAAAELVLLPRSKLLSLAHPEQALADAAGMLGRQEVPTLLTALLTLRRVAIHHHALLGDSLDDVMALLMECLQGGDAAVGQAALLALLDLLISFGSTLLRHCEHRTVPQYSCLLGLLLAASCGRTPASRYWANECLRYMAERLHQGRVIRLLEPYQEHPQAPVRNKASEWLMVATYRPHGSSKVSPRDSPATTWPASPASKWRD